MIISDKQQNEPKSKKKLSPLMGMGAAMLLCIEFLLMMRFFDAAHAPILVGLALAALSITICFLRDFSRDFASEELKKICNLFFNWLFLGLCRTFLVDDSTNLDHVISNKIKSLCCNRAARKEKIDFSLNLGALLRLLTLAPSFPRIVLPAA